MDNKNFHYDLRTMIADHMEAGFLENIIDMFRHDSTLYSLVADLIQDERVRVRVGITAMIEELAACDTMNVSKAVQNLLPLLNHREPVVRGDVSHLLGIVGDTRAIPLLESALMDENPDVRLLAKEALEELRKDLPK
jgi:HEAT repeat protein